MAATEIVEAKRPERPDCKDCSPADNEKVLNVLLESMSPEDRVYHGVTYHQCWLPKQAVDILCEEGITFNISDGLYKIQLLIDEGFIQHVVDKDKPVAYTDDLFFKFTQKTRYDKTLLKIFEKDDMGRMTVTTGNLYRLYKVLTSVLEVRDREFRGTTYPQCWLATDAVQCMLDLGYAKDEEDAVRIGQSLIDNQVIEHVVEGESKKFMNEYLFFRFMASSSVLHSFETSIVDDETHRLERVITEVSMKTDIRELPSEAKRKKLIKCWKSIKMSIEPKDLSYRGTTYRNVISNMDMVESLMDGKMAISTEEAGYICHLFVVSGLIIHCVDSSKPFLTDDLLYFKYTTARSREQIEKDCEAMIFTEEEISEHVEKVNMVLKTAVHVKDRKHLLRTYKDCFTAESAVKTLMSLGVSHTEEHAVMECQRLVCSGKIEHVVDKKKAFANEHLFFRFVDMDDSDSSADTP